MFIGINFLLYLVISSIISFLSIYLNSFGLSESEISFLFMISNFITLFLFIIFPIVIIFFNIYKIFLVSLLVFISSLFLFLQNNLIIIYFSLFIFLIGRVLSRNSSTLIFKNLVNSFDFSKIQGLYFVFINLSWIISPVLFGFIINLYGINLMFIISILIIIICTFLFTLNFKSKMITVSENTLNMKNFKEIDLNFFKIVIQKNFLLIYMTSLGPYIWFILTYVYMPLFIVFNFEEVYYVGLYIALINILNLITSYYLIKFISFFSIKKLYVLGYFFSFIGTFSIFFINPFYTILITLIINIFVGVLEPINEIIFFKLFSGNNANLSYSIYNSSSEVSSIITLLLIGLILTITEFFNIIFIIISLLFFLLFILSLKIPLLYGDNSTKIS
ncbi:MAG: MFS transporter [Nanoarchaeota archaeon]|nr:MFS transporter [Nanoarchaeota archaeon]